MKKRKIEQRNLICAQRVKRRRLEILSDEFRQIAGAKLEVGYIDRQDTKEERQCTNAC